jgi:Leucine-rich repeat (LRR) protein
LSGINGLSGLKELYASYNSIADISELAWHGTLTLIDLEGNDIGELD